MSVQGDILSFLMKSIADSDVLIEMPRVFGVAMFDVTKYVVTMWVLVLVLVLCVFLAFRSMDRGGKFVGGRVRVLFEMLVEFVEREMVRPHFHENHGRWTALFLTLFFYIMLCNLFGLVPGAVSLTGNIGVTGALAAVIFCITQINGMRAHGIVGYWKHLVPEGVPKALAPLIFIIECVGLFTKPFSLTVRLFANMLAGAIIILILSFLVAELSGSWTQIGVAPFVVAGSLAVILLKIFVAILQAYIFTLLSIIFISSAQGKH